MGLAYPTNAKVKETPDTLKHRGSPTAAPAIPARLRLLLLCISLLASSLGLHDDFPLLDQIWMLIVQATSQRQVCELDAFTEGVQSKAFGRTINTLAERPVKD